MRSGVPLQETYLSWLERHHSSDNYHQLPPVNQITVSNTNDTNMDEVKGKTKALTVISFAY